MSEQKPKYGFSLDFPHGMLQDREFRQQARETLMEAFLQLEKNVGVLSHPVWKESINVLKEDPLTGEDVYVDVLQLRTSLL